MELRVITSIKEGKASVTFPQSLWRLISTALWDQLTHTHTLTLQYLYRHVRAHSHKHTHTSGSSTNVIHHTCSEGMDQEPAPRERAEGVEGEGKG